SGAFCATPSISPSRWRRPPCGGGFTLWETCRRRASRARRTWEYTESKRPDFRRWQRVHHRSQERQHDDRRRLAVTDTRPVDDQAPLPESLPVSVLMERRPGVTRWAAVAWDAVAVLPDEGGVRGEPEVMVERDDYLQLRYRGLRVP